MAENSSRALREFQAYVEFLKGLWGSLSSISVAFPLSNALLKVVPMGTWPEGGFVSFSTPLITSVASLVSLFLVIWTFVSRHRFRTFEAWEKLSRKAAVSMIAAIAFLMVYLMAHYAISSDFYFGVLGWGSDDMRRVLGDAGLLLCYVGFFFSMTRAFLMLAMKEFLRQSVQEDV